MTFRRRNWLLWPALLAAGGLALTAGGCIEREGRPVNPCTNVTIGQAIQVNTVDKVDLLFMVDNSNSMTEEQTSLAAEFPRMINILATGDLNQDGDSDDEEDFDPVQDLHVGVITSDMGTGGFEVPTCPRSDFGDDGVLRTEGRADLEGCMATYPSFLAFERDVNDPTSFANDVACVATVGTGGCGFEQQLEAVLKASSPSAPTAWTADGYDPPMFYRGTFGHADRANEGFIRENSVLAIIPVTDEEDCSARDAELFNPTSATYTADLNLRCFMYGAEALHPITRYVDGLLALRQRPGLLIYAPITGIPVDLAPGTGEQPNFDLLVGDIGVRDERMVERIDSENPNRLEPSCSVPGRGVAFPPVRIVQVAQELQANGAGVTVQSICQESYRNALTEIIRQIKSALGAACLPRRLNVEADGTVACDVVALLPEGQDCGAIRDSSPKLDEDGQPVLENNRALCVMPQLVPTAEERSNRSAPTGNGWYYDNYTAEGADNCQRSEGDPFQRIAFTTQPPSGAEVRLECFQSVQDQGGQGEVRIGTFCEPEGDTLCPGGQTPTGSKELSCDPIQRTCGVSCVTDAECSTAGLIGFVCDDRPREVVEPERFSGDTAPYNHCVNPTCS